MQILRVLDELMQLCETDVVAEALGQGFFRVFLPTCKGTRWLVEPPDDLLFLYLFESRLIGVNTQMLLTWDVHVGDEVYTVQFWMLDDHVGLLLVRD